MTTPPTLRIVVAAVVIRDDAGRILLVRKEGTARFMLPGGKIEPDETAAHCAAREAHEELGVELDSSALTELGAWEAPAANEPGHTVHGTVFTHPFVEGIAAAGEIAEVMWFDPASPGEAELAPLFEHRVLPLLAGS